MFNVNPGIRGTAYWPIKSPRVKHSIVMSIAMSIATSGKSTIRRHNGLAAPEAC